MTDRRGLFTIIALILVVACSGKPPLRISAVDRGVMVDVQTLGEYLTTVKRIHLTNAATGATVWDLRAARGSQGPQIWTFTLREGENPVQLTELEFGRYDVFAPRGCTSFTLARGIEYEVAVYGESGRASRAKFRIE